MLVLFQEFIQKCRQLFLKKKKTFEFIRKLLKICNLYFQRILAGIFPIIWLRISTKFPKNPSETSTKYHWVLFRKKNPQKILRGSPQQLFRKPSIEPRRNVFNLQFFFCGNSFNHHFYEVIQGYLQIFMVRFFENIKLLKISFQEFFWGSLRKYFQRFSR